MLHPSTELVRVSLETLFGLDDAHFVKPLNDLLIPIGDLGSVKRQGLRHLRANRQNGIQGGAGFLENVSDLLAPDFAQLALIEREHVVSAHRKLGG